MRITVGQLVTTLLGLTAVVLAWLFLAPHALGGSTTYVITHGTSMQPRFHAGDMALVRESGDYRVGDIVAYQSRELGKVVLHRIVARDGNKYVFKGDNNSWLDPEHPTRDQLIGKLWVRLPGFGHRIQQVYTPWTMAILIGLAALLLAGGAGVATHRRRRLRRAEAADASWSQRRPRPAGQSAQSGLAVAAVGLLACLGLGALAFTKPTTKIVSTPLAYEQTGRFSYSASAAKGDVYPSGRLQTGEPVFLRLVDRMRVQFDYRLKTRPPHNTAGNAALIAELASSNGWKRTLTLQPATRFDGDRVRLAGTLELAPIRTLLTRFEAATDVSNATYSLEVAPRVHVTGFLAGSSLRTSFAPRLSFSLDQLQLRPDLSANSAGPAESAPKHALTPATNGSVEVANRTARTLSLRALHIRIKTARRLAAIGGAASIVALLVCGLMLLRGRRADEPARIQARYRDWLIPVARSDRRSYDEVVEVKSIETLARLAERYDRMILHEESELGHSYRVAEEGVLYVYLIGAPEGIPLASRLIPSQPTPSDTGATPSDTGTRTA
jgi:signal peptidase I